MASFYDASGTSQADLIDGRINQKFFADFAVVRSINPDKTINVEHAILQELIDSDQPLPPTITKNVEVLFFGSKDLYVESPIKVGDTVLLIGLQNFLPTAKNLTQAKQAVEFIHYEQESAKALPIGIIENALAKITINDSGTLILSNDAVGGKIAIRNQLKSIFTVFDDFATNIDNAFTAATPGPMEPGLVTLKTQFPILIAKFKSDLAMLFEA